MDERQHTPAESDYARGYRMSLVELQSLREQLAASQATITELVAALKAVESHPNGGCSAQTMAQVRAVLALVPPAVGQGE